MPAAFRTNDLSMTAAGEASLMTLSVSSAWVAPWPLPLPFLSRGRSSLSMAFPVYRRSREKNSLSARDAGHERSQKECSVLCGFSQKMMVGRGTVGVGPPGGAGDMVTGKRWLADVVSISISIHIEESHISE